MKEKYTLAEIEVYLRKAAQATGLGWGLAEEAGIAYKDIHAVVQACELSGISKKVAAFEPIGNIDEGYLIIPKFKKTNSLTHTVRTCLSR